jgi:hypothetical protein
VHHLRDKQWLGAGVVAGLALAAVIVADTSAAEGRKGSARSSSGETSDAPAPARNAAVRPPRTIFDCDTPRGEDWYGSADRCLAEMCAGGNFTNQYVDGPGNKPRKNPCYGRDPYELQR